MPAAVSAGAIRIPNVGIAFGFFLKKTEEVWSKYSVVSWI